MWHVFSHLVMVGNLTTITATIDHVWWQYDYYTLFRVTCPCPFLQRCFSLYVHPFKATMNMSNVHNTQAYGNFCWMPSKYGYHLSSLAKVNKHVTYGCQHVFFYCSWSMHNVVVQNDLSYWGWLVYTVHVCHEYQYSNCLRHVLCYINMFCSTANMFPRHNKVAYSFNTHCTFIIVHSHIPKGALQLLCTLFN